MNDVLDAEQIERFVELGYCKLADAFTRQQATAARECVWRRMEQKAGIRRDDPSTWPGVYDIEERLANPEVLACFTDRLAAGVEQLVGRNRWSGARNWGFWPVNFWFGAGEPYDVPTSGWHIDGNWFRHRIDCPLQGLLVIGLFTDIWPGGGGTILAAGSHKQTARVLARHADGISHLDLFSEVLGQPLGNFQEITGAAGDVLLAHPFLFHSRGVKRYGLPRFISNTEAPLREPLQLVRPCPSEYSVLERSIIQALSESPVAPKGARMCRF